TFPWMIVAGQAAGPYWHRYIAGSLCGNGGTAALVYLHKSGIGQSLGPALCGGRCYFLTPAADGSALCAAVLFNGAESLRAIQPGLQKNYVLQTIHAMGGFENLSYTPVKGFPYNEVWDSCVVATGDPKYYESEDLLVGTYRGMPFAYCD